MKKILTTIGLASLLSLLLPLSAFAVSPNRACDGNADMTLNLVQGTAYSYPTDSLYSPFGTAFIYGTVDGIDFPWEDSNHRGIVGTPTNAGTYDLHINCNPGYVAFTVVVALAFVPVPPPVSPAQQIVQTAGQATKDNLLAMLVNGIPYIVVVGAAFAAFRFVWKKVKGQAH